MPVVEITAPAEQLVVREARRLVAPAEAARILGVSRQAIDKAAGKSDGPYLIWRFSNPGRRPGRHVDFGAVADPPDPAAWSAAVDDPRDLLSEPSPAGPVPIEADAEIVLHLLATGIVALADADQPRRPVLPYPRPLQRALDRLTVLAWRHGARPPMGVPELLASCTRPLREWLPTLPEEAAAANDVLIVDGSPTSLCREWAIDAADVEGEVYENRIMRGAISICRAQGDQQSYVRFRRLLIERPVLTAFDFQRYSVEPGFHQLTGALREAYMPVPPQESFAGNVCSCAECGHLIVHAGRGRRCSNDRCTSGDRPETGVEIPLLQAPLVVRPPVRTFVSLPGVAEVRLEARIASLDVQATLWPNFDAYDLRVEFRDGEAWAVDVKDWASPVALARHLSHVRSFRTDPPWTRAFFVFPTTRVRNRPEYLRIFRHFYRGEAGRISVLTEDAFLRHVERRRREPRGERHA